MIFFGHHQPYFITQDCDSIHQGKVEKTVCKSDKIEVIRSARLETILGKFPAIFNGH